MALSTLSTLALLASTAFALPRLPAERELESRSIATSISQLLKRSDSYTFYSGDGTIAAGWPANSDWVSFNTMWNNNYDNMKSSCQDNGWGVADDSTTELSEMKSAIQTVASASGVDERFILAVVLQESSGCVRVPTTSNGVNNPGLMQSYDGSGTCNNDGAVQNPCPGSEIKQMIVDGTEGTEGGSGWGLEQCIANAPNPNAVAGIYQAARIYNSGSIASSGNLDNGNGATACYSCDIANRLTGWVNAASCCKNDGNTAVNTC